jgi:DNA-binding transcriptional LysR family regulator
VTLFYRRPFSLTPDGEKLYKFIFPFFSNIEKVTMEMQGGEARHIRIGASSIILREHLPSLLRDLRKKFPTLKISLREGYPAHLENLLAREEIDLAVTLLEKKTGTGIHTRELLELPMVLLVEKSSGITSAEQLWKRDRISEPLICLPPGELICKQFQQKITELGVDWFPSIEASSADLVETYVANGLGIGVSVAIPKKALPENIVALPLPNFPPVIIGAMWRGRTTQLLQVILNEFQARAKKLMQGS